MKTLVLLVALAGAFELLWASHPVLRARRAHFRAMVALFWTITATVWAGNSWELLPHLYLNDVPRFASDAVTYQAQASHLADGLRNGSIVAYGDWRVFHYSKLLGLIFYLFDDSRLAGGLFNVIFYMASVLSVFVLGRRLFDERAGLWAAWLAACWPVFLLYETQTLRWVSTTAGLHLLMAGTVLAMGGGRVYLSMLCGLAGFAILLVDLPQLAGVACVLAFTLATLLLIADLRVRARPVRAARVLAMAGVMVVAYNWVWLRPVPTQAPSSATMARPSPAPPEPWRRPARPLRTAPASPAGPGELGQAWLPEHLRVPPPRQAIDRLVAPILVSRSGYLRQNEELRRDGIAVGTMLDGRPLTGARDFVANIPAALASAILIPTPASLLDARNGASRLGPVVAGEMIVYYFLVVAMCVGVAQALCRNAESRLATIYLLLFTGAAYVSIGTVAMNGGTLHRFRLPYVVIHMAYAAPVLAVWVPALMRRVSQGRR